MDFVSVWTVQEEGVEVEELLSIPAQNIIIMMAQEGEVKIVLVVEEAVENFRDTCIIYMSNRT